VNEKPDVLGIAIAGPVNNNKVERFMNINWKGFSCKEITESFGIKNVFLLNDFQAVGNYAPYIDL
jgi:glucokinase